MFSEKRSNVLHGILLIALFSCSAFYIAEFPFVKNLSFSPLIVGILLGMVYANSLRNHLPETWVPGILFCTKQVLRAGIVLYGFRLTSTGSAICGAAAVLGAEPVVKSEPHKTAVAVSTVVIFGTLSMFIYPAMYRAGILDLTSEQMGLYTGSTLHEVAHVVGAGNVMGKEISDTAIIVKMIRVMMLAPVLVMMSFALARTAVKAVSDSVKETAAVTAKRGKITIPWFAFGFLAVIGFNSFDLLPHAVVDGINNIDTFMLTMAMTALGTETSIEKFKKAGAKPFILAAVLYIWLLGGGYLLAKYLV